MKHPALLFLLPMLLAAGCSSIELAPPADPDRVVSGSVRFDAGAALPENSILTIRVVDFSDPAMGPKILGEQQIIAPGTPPVAFRVEFHAEDAALRSGVRIEARLSVDGRVRFTTATNYPVTDLNVSNPREIWLAPAGG